MKNLLLAGVAGVALVAGAPAGAADLGTQPYKAPPVWAPVLLFTWSGCYIGGHVGGGWGRKDFSDTGDGAFVGDGKAPQSIRVDTSGFLGGGQIGCDYQFAPNWVVGIEGDFSGADIKGSAVDPFFPTTGKTLHARTDWLATATGRLGWAWDRLLIYIKGGAAWAHDKYGADEPVADGTVDCAPPAPCTYNASETRIGWTAGVGLEWAFWSNWSAKLEYDFYGFGHRDLLFTCTNQAGFCGLHGPVSIKQEINVFKAGLNWRFNFGKAPAPVVAKY
jgi:outer membrane immunogenic protein